MDTALSEHIAAARTRVEEARDAERGAAATWHAARHALADAVRELAALEKPAGGLR